MSKIKVQQPVVHLPSFKRWAVPRGYVQEVITALGLEPLYPGVHNWYWYTDLDGCSKLLPHLLQKSDLYKKDIFTCINYAFKVWLMASSGYNLNTWLPVVGRIPNYMVCHAWNTILLGNELGLIRDHFLYFEPNDGWAMGTELETAYQAFSIGEEGYTGEKIFY